VGLHLKVKKKNWGSGGKKGNNGDVRVDHWTKRSRVRMKGAVENRGRKHREVKLLLRKGKRGSSMFLSKQPSGGLFQTKRRARKKRNGKTNTNLKIKITVNKGRGGEGGGGGGEPKKSWGGSSRARAGKKLREDLEGEKKMKRDVWTDEQGIKKKTRKGNPRRGKNPGGVHGGSQSLRGFRKRF